MHSKNPARKLALLLAIISFGIAALNFIQPVQPALASGVVPITGFAWEGINSKQYAFIGDNGHVYELYALANGAWAYADLTQITRVPVAGND
jgi:hypothetical protein